MHIGADADGRELIVRVWPNGANIERGDEQGARSPPTSRPTSSRPRRAEELLAQRHGGPRELGTDPETGLTVLVLTGRFGPFVQLGEQEPTASKEKPKRASLFAIDGPATRSRSTQALALLSLPRVVGVDAEGVEITAQNGRYGPVPEEGHRQPQPRRRRTSSSR